jgi:chromosome segregation ATPase
MAESVEQQVTQMFANLLPQILAPQIAAKQRQLAELGQEIERAKAERESVRAEVSALRVEAQGLADSISQQGKEFLELKARRRAFILGEDLPDTEKFLTDVQRFREEA